MTVQIRLVEDVAVDQHQTSHSGPRKKIGDKTAKSPAAYHRHGGGQQPDLAVDADSAHTSDVSGRNVPALQTANFGFDRRQAFILRSFAHLQERNNLPRPLPVCS